MQKRDLFIQQRWIPLMSGYTKYMDPGLNFISNF